MTAKEAEAIVNVKRTSMVKPAIITPRQTMFLSNLDLGWLLINNVQRLFFYPQSPFTKYSTLIEGLKKSLSSVLVYFYPLAGRLKMGESGRIEVDCNDEGVGFREAPINILFQDLEKDGFRCKPFFPELVHEVDLSADETYTRPLLLIQCTAFEGGGICIGTTLYHVIADGNSFWHFMTSWAECSRGLPLSKPPQHERTVWNLFLQGKPLALTQGCSAKIWNRLGISTFIDLFENDCLIKWDELRIKYNLPAAHKKTYNMITRACTNIPSICLIDSHRFINSKWPDGTVLWKTKAKNVYNTMNNNQEIIKHVNTCWYTSLDTKQWNKNFYRNWKSYIDPKIKCFKWLILINRLPISSYLVPNDLCKLCNRQESYRHIFFECKFAQKVWALCGVTYPKYIDILEILTGYIHGLKNDSNILWFIISSNILWQLWKCRNEERFQGVHRSLTELFLKLTLLKISSQVCITMMIEKEKLSRFLKMGHSAMFVFEMKDGYNYRNHMNNMVLFNKTVKKLHKEIVKNKNATDDQIKMIAQIQANKSIAWMEGPLGWTAWMEQYEDLLH
ncbi:hypothetical protein SUGI_0683500 [Cryptomeria japonica]|nr:hypothetical protein SUGI_0683500 [Cryptomeria japonica]